MNFLAHLYLSSHDENLLIGNFIADEVKGKQFNNYPIEISRGILMHRFIDYYTDTHPNVLASTKILRPYLSKFSPVALDVFFDYFLAKNWQTHHPNLLVNFTASTYKILQKNEALMPEKSRYILKYMSQQNWLLNYAEIDGIKKSLTGMASRSKYGSILQGGEKFLIQFEDELNQHFNLFFEALKLELKKTDWTNY
jgi:acyl carrier protein phosphodiesterase